MPTVNSVADSGLARIQGICDIDGVRSLFSASNLGGGSGIYLGYDSLETNANFPSASQAAITFSMEFRDRFPYGLS